MRYKDYETAFSAARLDKYRNACGGNEGKALILYRHNVKLCQKFYGVLNIFEIVLRNAVNRHYAVGFGEPDWIWRQLQADGMLAQFPQRNKFLEEIASLKRAGKYSPDKVVASATFGFWTHLFTKVPFRLGGQTLLRIFPFRQTGLGQKAVFKELQRIKKFRNRIAHHEPICFDSSGNKSMADARENYALIRKYISFLGYAEAELFYGFDVLPDAVIDKIERL